MSYQSVDDHYDGDDESRGPLLHEREEFHSFSPPSPSHSSLFSSFTPRYLKVMAVAFVAFLVVALLLRASSSSSSASTEADLASAALSQRGHGHHHSDSYAHHPSNHHSSHGSDSDGDSTDDSDRHSRNSQHGHRTPPPEPEEDEPQEEDPKRDRRDREKEEREPSGPRSPAHSSKPSSSSSSRSKHGGSHPRSEQGINNDDESTGSEAEQSSNQAASRSNPSPLVGNNPEEQTPAQRDAGRAPGSPLTLGNCEPPYPGYPYCESKVNELMQSWRSDAESEAKYRAEGVDGGKCSFLTFLNKNGFFCPEATDYNRGKIRGVNLGGWLVLEPWIRPSLFTQFAVEDEVKDQWTFCEKLGKEEARRQLEKHWDSWLTKDDLQQLVDGGINHVRIPVGYWILGDIQEGEPWVSGDLAYLERGLRWIRDVGLHAILDLHCAPGSQNGFDNSGRMGEVHFADSDTASNGRVTYPNIDRALDTIDALTKHFSADEYKGTVVGIELVNEAFISIPLEIVKDYYVQGYERVKRYGDLAVVIGDSFRFGSWGDFMFPPHYRHVWIDTHVYQSAAKTAHGVHACVVSWVTHDPAPLTALCCVAP